MAVDLSLDRIYPITPLSTFLDHRHCTVCGAVAMTGTLQNISVKAEQILCDKCSKEED